MGKKESNPPPPSTELRPVVFGFKEDLVKEILNDLWRIAASRTEWKVDRLQMAERLIEENQKIAYDVIKKMKARYEH